MSYMKQNKKRKQTLESTPYLLLLTMVSVKPHLLRAIANSSFPSRLSESQGMFNLGQICQNSEAKI